MDTPEHFRKRSARLAVHDGAPLAIATFYEDVAAAGKAAALVTRLAEKFGGEFEVKTNLWSFDVLRVGSVADFAAAQASEADLIVVAADCARSLPSEVAECIEAAMTLRGQRSLGFVALPTRAAPGDSAPVCGFLKTLCRHDGDSFFCADDPPLDTCQLTPDRVHHRARSSTAVLDGIMRRPLRPEP